MTLQAGEAWDALLRSLRGAAQRLLPADTRPGAALRRLLIRRRRRRTARRERGTAVERVRSAGRSGHARILVLDDRVPTGDTGAGYPRAFALLEMLGSLGFEVTLYPLVDPTPYQPWLSRLERVGIEAICSEQEFEEFAAARCGLYDVVLVSRLHNLRDTEDALRRWFSDATLVYDAEALLFQRDRLKAHLGAGRKTVAAANERLELALLRRADLIVAVSEREERLMTSAAPELEGRVRVWGHPLAARPSASSFDARNGLLFLGSFFTAESPNEDAILHFVREILPQVRRRFDCTLHIVGYNPPRSVRRCASQHVHVVGYVNDPTPYYEGRRVFVVPHRFAAGIPLKLCEAMARGLPAVVSELAAEQLSVEDGHEVLVGRTPEQFAEAVVRLHDDERLWHRLRDGALSYVRSAHDPALLEQRLDDIVSEALARSRAHSRG